MNGKTFIVAFIASVAIVFVQAQPTAFDPVTNPFTNPGTDFSISTNPWKTWQYGYSTGGTLAPDQFRLDTYVDTSDPIAFWHPAKSEGNGPGYYPYVAFNPTGKARANSSNGWAMRAGEIAMEGSNTGQYSLVRFVAPQSGAYHLEGRFEGIHFGLSSTDVHVLKNAVAVFDADIEGYGGDPAFHRMEGVSPTAAFSATLDLRAGDTITFAVGYGKNKTHFNDTTGLMARIALLPGK